MFIGEFAPALFFKIGTYIIIPTLFIIYYISQVEGHEPPFPHCWISKVAQHYPQFVFFRIATISGGAFMALGWLTNHFYLQTVAKETGFPIYKYHIEVFLIVGLIGSMLLMGNTATIDTGKMNEDWHSTCASNFFVFTLIAQTLNTIFGWVFYQKTHALSLRNLYAKTGIILLLVVQLLISSFQGQIGIFDEEQSLGNDIAKLLEWTLTATIIMGFYSMSLDYEKFVFVYENNSKENSPVSSIEAIN